MPIAFQSRATYRLPTQRGLTTMRELWQAGAWIADRLGQQVTIEGVERAKSPPALEAATPMAADARTAAKLTAPVPVLRFARSGGLALAQDLHTLSAWLAPLLQQSWRNADSKIILRRGHATTPPLPPQGGVLSRRAFAAFLRAVGQSLGFEVEAPDLAGSRDSGAGFHVHRRAAGLAALAVTTRLYSGRARACHLGFADPEEDGYITSSKTTYEYENGSFDVTTTINPDVQGIGPLGSFDECDMPSDSSTEIPGFDYGSYVGETTTPTIATWDSVRAAAEGAVDWDDADSAGYADEWTPDAWAAESAATRAEFIGTSSSSLSIVGSGWIVNRPRYRLANTGNVRLAITITHERTSDSTTESTTVNLNPGQTSDWLLTRAPAASEQWTTRITRIRIAGL